MPTHYQDPATKPKRVRNRTAESRRAEYQKRNTGMPAGRPPKRTGAYAILCDLKKAGCVHRHHETGEPLVLISREDGTAYPILLSSLVGLTIGAVNYLALEEDALATREEKQRADNETRGATAAAIWGR